MLYKRKGLTVEELKTSTEIFGEEVLDMKIHNGEWIYVENEGYIDIITPAVVDGEIRDGYFISMAGLLYSSKRGDPKPLTSESWWVKKTKAFQKSASMSFKGKTRTYSIADLLVEAFLREPKTSTEINEKDYDDPTIWKVSTR